MKKLFLHTTILLALFCLGCNTAKKAEAKRKRDAEKMEQLDKDKKQFEQKLGK